MKNTPAYDLRNQPISELSMAHLKGRIHKLNDRERELTKELADVQKMRNALEDEIKLR
jgi:predicted  nucleic acid-binding Zn-ribbon protein